MDNPSAVRVTRKLLTRRTFLKGTAASAVIAGVAAAGPGRNVLEALATVESGAASDVAEEKVFSNLCTMACMGGCRIMTHVRDGKVVQCTMGEMVDPNFNRICMRGFTHPQRIYSPDRLKYPLKRVGERGEGKFEQISWDEAISTIVQKFDQIRGQYGAKALGFYSTTGFNGFFNFMMPNRLANVMGASLIDPCSDYADTYGLGQLLGSGFGFGQGNDWAGFVDARTILIWGTNPCGTNPHIWHFIMDAREKGTKVITIDPCFTATAAKSDIFLGIRPGGDTALALAMSQHIIANDWIDQEFLLNHTVAPFLVREDTKKFLRSSDITGQPVAPEQAKTAYLVWDPATLTAQTLDKVAAPALEGSFEVNGIRVSTAYALLKKHVAPYTPEEAAKLCDIPAETIKEVARLYAVNTPSTIHVGYAQYDNSMAVGHAWGILAALTGNIGKKGAGVGHVSNFGPNFDPVPLLYPLGFTRMASAVPMLKVGEMLETGKLYDKDYPLKAMFIWGNNMVNSQVNRKYTIENIMKKLDFIVTLDMFSSETTNYSDIVLPVAYWFETDDIFAFSHNHMGVNEKAIEPAFESRCTADIIRDIALGLGYEAEFKASNEELMAGMISAYGKSNGLTYETLKRDKLIKSNQERWVSYENKVFKTPSTRLEFYLEDPKPRINLGQKIDKDSLRLPVFAPPREAWPDNPLFQKYPIILFAERNRWRVHSQFSTTPWIKELEPELLAKINPDDAAERGIENGDIIEIYNDRGHVVMKTTLNKGVRPGMVIVPKGWNAAIAGHYNDLTDSYVNDVHLNQVFYDCLCNIRLYKEGR
ncbi:hypothetical protein AT727_19735 [Desulfitobacterium hafniense]|uniref:4Fe-4S Mo/W bis-MGD-type domain-containing protein n=1 Tax=Desulfitobacterium hafniense TaxID=49338 RepID=A0A0W1JLD5_DESHA|nr:molybdopterin-dependent oxidoreductase [Desulfitobacterium hafniense]KTE92419.1 hypothetical protein AT727_19735 [Desulfitobacterium hafniense]